MNVDNVAAIVGGSPLSSGTRNSRVDHSMKNPHSPNPGVMSNTKHVQISTQKQHENQGILQKMSTPLTVEFRDTETGRMSGVLQRRSVTGKRI